ncbi:MAG TPA: hypothetical protein VEP50_16655 [bacterium]|nr:hypothetical protein [bacterium]
MTPSAEDGRSSTTSRTGSSQGGPEDETHAVVTYTLYDQNGRQIPCHLCGGTDCWTVEREGVVFVCEHEPIALTRGAIRQLSSMPASRVAAFEFVGLKKPLPASGMVPWVCGLGT